MADDDGIEIKIRLYAPRPAPRYRVVIDGDLVLEFPEGTTREQAESVLEEAKRRYLEEYIAKA
jgi:hypothetical protein